MSEAAKSFGSFVGAIERATSVEEVSATFLAATEQVGFEYVALFTCAYPGDSPQRAISFARIPPAWLERYYDRRYHEIDPVFATVRRRLNPFNWNDPAYTRGLTEAQNAMLAENDEAGLVDGLAIPIRDPGALPACCTLVPCRDGVDPASYAMAHSLAVFAHGQARRLMGETLYAPATRMPRRERECLLLAAQGKSDWAIGEVLGLSERTVHHAIERAKRRFGVSTRVQAIIHAVAAGEFSATDAIA
jgi:LuxR family transcriptional regulator, quorum-sensing system regulator BjaR1